MRNYKSRAFTLIELLMVIAIIGILASILIPVVGIVKEKANITASKSQLSGYVNAIGLFKGEYNYFPFPEAHEDGGATIPTIGVDVFVGTLSATDLDGTRLTGSNNYGNRRLIDFYTFSETDFLDGDSQTGQISDRFDNVNIFIAIDGDGDGSVDGLPDPSGGGGTKEVRTKITAYVLNAPETSKTPDYYLYD